MGKDESGDAPQIKRRGKDTTATAATIRRARGKYFQQNDQHQIDQQQIAITIKHGIVHHRIPFGCGSSVQQQLNRIVSFTVERREKENQHTQHHTAESKFLIGIIELAEHALHRIHGTCEIKRNQTAKDTQQNDIRNTFQFERLIEVEFKHSLRTGSNIGNGSCRDRRNQQRKQGRHGKVNHQNFQCKYQSRNRCFKDTGNRTRRTTTYEQHQCTVLHLEHTSQIGADSGACQDDRRLRPNRPTKTDSYRTGNDRRPNIMSFDASLSAGNGIQNLCDSMTDIVFNNVAYKPACQENSDYRIYQIQIVSLGHVEIIGQEILYLMDKEFQY